MLQVAAERLGVDPAACLVIEDSSIGLAAALGAGMRCAITYTSSTSAQAFEGACCVLESLNGVGLQQLVALSEERRGSAVVDDRQSGGAAAAAAATAAAVVRS